MDRAAARARRQAARDDGDARPGYLYAEFTSRLMGFVDDVEFLLEAAGAIQVRSASRLGKGDLGVNRARIEAIRALLDAELGR